MKNSPLIEIVAEVRWGKRPQQGQPIIISGNDEQYIRYGIELGKLGYDILERVLPEGLPSMPGAITYRYRKKAEGNQNTLYQLGSGIFTCNGLPPYADWAEFMPFIDQGLNALFKSSIISSEDEIQLVLRYVDAFSKEHLGELTHQAFYSSVLGVSYAAPQCLAEFGMPEEFRGGRFSISHVSDSGSKYSIDAAVGKHENRDVVVVSTIGQSAKFKAESPEAVLARYEPLQAMLHKVFFEIIARNSEVNANITG